MARPTLRRSPRLETLEARQLLSADVTGEQQLMLELINEALINPESAAERVEQTLTRGAITAIGRDGNSVEDVISEIASAEPRPPVAWDASLAEAAKKHTEYQIRLGAQTHDGPRGLETATDRVLASGYGRPEAVAENIIYGASSAEHAMNAFLADYGPGNGHNPHRENIQQTSSPRGESLQDVGVAVVPVEVAVDRTTPFGSPAPTVESRVVVTQVFARKDQAAPKILGVVYNDANSDEFYDVGEGVANAQVTITHTTTGETNTVRTWSSGGYQAEVAPGHHRVEVRVNDRVVGRRDVVVGQENTKVDFRVNEAPKTSAQVAVTTTPTSTSTSNPTTPSRTAVPRPSVAPQRSVAPAPSRPVSSPTPAPASPSSATLATRTRAADPAPTAPPTLPTSAIDPASLTTGSPVRTVAREALTSGSRPASPSDASSNDTSSAISLLKSSLTGTVRSWRIAESGSIEAELAASSR